MVCLTNKKIFSKLPLLARREAGFWCYSLLPNRTYHQPASPPPGPLKLNLWVRGGRACCVLRAASTRGWREGVRACASVVQALSCPVGGKSPSKVLACEYWIQTAAKRCEMFRRSSPQVQVPNPDCQSLRRSSPPAIGLLRSLS